MAVSKHVSPLLPHRVGAQGDFILALVYQLRGAFCALLI